MKDSELKEIMRYFKDLSSGRFELVVLDSKTNEVMMDCENSYNKSLDYMLTTTLKAAIQDVVRKNQSDDSLIVKKEKTDLCGNKVVLGNISNKLQ